MRPVQILTTLAVSCAVLAGATACDSSAPSGAGPTTTAFDGLFDGEDAADPSEYELVVTFCGVNEVDLPKLPADPMAYLDKPYIVGGTAPPGDPDGRGYEIAAGDGVYVAGTLTNRSERVRRFNVDYKVVGTERTIMGTLFAGTGLMSPGRTRHFYSQSASLDGPIGEVVECHWSVRDHISDRLHPPEQD